MFSTPPSPATLPTLSRLSFEPAEIIAPHDRIFRVIQQRALLIGMSGSILRKSNSSNARRMFTGSAGRDLPRSPTAGAVPGSFLDSDGFTHVGSLTVCQGLPRHPFQAAGECWCDRFGINTSILPAWNIMEMAALQMRLS